MNKKTILIIILFLSVLFSGCTQKLTEQQLEEKAKEEFYELEDADVFGVYFKASDFILGKSEILFPQEIKLFDFECKGALSGNCLMTENEFYSLNEKVHIYNFQLKEETKRDDRTMWGKVILKNNGEVIAKYINGLEHFI